MGYCQLQIARTIEVKDWMFKDIQLEKGEILRGFDPKNTNAPTGSATYPKMSKNAFLTSENGAFKECTRKMDKYGKKNCDWGLLYFKSQLTCTPCAKHKDLSIVQIIV